MYCENCKKDLEALDIAMSKKLLSRATERFYCIACLAEWFGVRKELLFQKAIEFKKSGCMLFNNVDISKNDTMIKSTM